MKKEKTTGLQEIKVQSFVTSLEREEQKWVKGGSKEAQGGTTSPPVFC